MKREIALYEVTSAEYVRQTGGNLPLYRDNLCLLCRVDCSHVPLHKSGLQVVDSGSFAYL